VTRIERTGNTVKLHSFPVAGRLRRWQFHDQVNLLHAHPSLPTGFFCFLNLRDGLVHIHSSSQVRSWAQLGEQLARGSFRQVRAPLHGRTTTDVLVIGRCRSCASTLLPCKEKNARERERLPEGEMVENSRDICADLCVCVCVCVWVVGVWVCGYVWMTACLRVLCSVALL
jgi:hypothetical protein